MALNRPLRWITVFGIGHMRPASGTWGSLPPLVIAAGMALMNAGPAECPTTFRLVMVGICLIFCIACIAQGTRAEQRYGKDPSEAVADETAGQAMTFACMPLLSEGATSIQTLAWLLGGFFAFRIFDIIKPWPARQIQSAPAGWGILLDDLFAALYAAAALWLTWYFIAR